MANNLLFRANFIGWLVEEETFTPGSANSYASYVSAIDKALIGTNFIETLDKELQAGKSYRIASVFDSIQEQLQQENIEKSLGIDTNTIRKWRSGILKYREFIDYLSCKNDNIDDSEDENDIEIIDAFSNRTKENNSSAIILVYTSNELKENFSFRLITQDRHYDDIYFPISFIKRFFYKKGNKQYFDKWIEDHINHIQIHTKSKSHLFKEISALRICIDGNESTVEVKIKDQYHSTYSKTADDLSLIPMNSKHLKSIVIDHVIPMKDIMLKNKSELNTLSIITSELKKHIHGRATSKKLKAAGSKLFSTNADIIKEIQIGSLIEELDLIKSLTNLQLMDKTENSKKGAN